MADTGEPITAAAPLGSAAAGITRSHKDMLFHIGLPKTGSTSIQTALVTLGDELTARGICFPYDRIAYAEGYPSAAMPTGAPQTDGLPHFFDVPQRRPGTSVDWETAVEDFLNDDTAHMFVFSHENMALLGDRLKRDRMKILSGRANLHFLAYLRNPTAYLDSYCLQLVYGHEWIEARASTRQVRRYIEKGFTGLLAPYRALGMLHLHDFDALRGNGGLLADFFETLGIPELMERTAALPEQNRRQPRVNLSAVLVALKQVMPRNDARRWFAVTPALIRAAADLEPPMSHRFLPATTIEAIETRWREDRRNLAWSNVPSGEHALQKPPGPDRLSFSREYFDELFQKVSSDLPGDLLASLRTVGAMAGHDVEQGLDTTPKVSME